MKFFNGAPKRNSQLLIWAQFKKLFTPTHSPEVLKTEELEREVEERTLELKQANRRVEALSCGYYFREPLK